MAGPLIDFGVLMFHNARLMAQQHAGPYFYLSKVESTEEARLWDGIFTWSEKHLDLGFGNFCCNEIPSFIMNLLTNAGAIKSCVLIENILATFEMESILYQLRHHCIGLNCGIWDYSASIISLFGTSIFFEFTSDCFSSNRNQSQAGGPNLSSRIGRDT